MHHSTAIRILVIAVLFALVWSLTAPILTYRMRIFQGDEATYWMMAESLAYDADLRYTPADLRRVIRRFPDGPQGLFLRRGEDGGLYYAKSFIYSLWAAPWVRLAGINGFVGLNVVLLGLAWGAGYAWCRRWGWSPGWALGWSLAFIGLSVVPAYVVWMTPEVFNFALVFLSLYLAFAPGVASQPSRVRDVVGALLAGMVTFSKPIAGVVFIVVGLVLWSQRAWQRLAVWVVVGGLVVGGLFGVYWLHTGDWNYMGGERKTFYGRFPLENPAITFERTGIYHSADITYAQEHYIDVPTVLWDFFYYFFGRYAGVLWYFTPGVLGIWMGIRSFRQSRWLLLGFLLMVLAFIITQPHNYLGGGGTLANRYFLCVYPWTFFMVTQPPRLASMAAVIGVATAFSLPIVASPFLSVRFPWKYAQGRLHTLLPLEYTQLENLPSNTYPHAFNVAFPHPGQPDYHAFFLNDAFYPREGPGFWVKGESTVRLVVKRARPFEGVRIRLGNHAPVPVEVRLRFGFRSLRVTVAPHSEHPITLQRPRGLRVRNVWMWPVTISVSRGFVPAFIDPENRDRRYLGVFVVIEPWTPVGGAVP